MFVCPSVTFVEFTSKFYIKVSPSGYISPTIHQKAFIFGPWVHWRDYFPSISSVPRVHAWGGAGGQKLGHLKKCYIAFFFHGNPF